MSLKVWIPFTDGTAKNQGTSNLTFTNYNSSVTYSNNSGKLGKCMLNTGFSGGGFISNTTINLGTNISMFCWVNPTAFTASANLNGIITNHHYETSSGMGLVLRYASSTTGYIGITEGRGSNGRTYDTHYGNTLLTAGNWYHIGFTYNGSTVTFYLNGNPDGTKSISGLNAVANYIGIFRWSDTYTYDYEYKGLLNDVRIYDHCLTPQEVKEISKGLVAHYTLGSDSVYEATTNIASSLTPVQNGGWGGMTITKKGNNWYHLKAAHTSADSWHTFVYTLPEDCLNQTITFSTHISNITTSNVNLANSWLFIGQGNDGLYPTHGSVTFRYNLLLNHQLLSWTGTLSNSHRYLIIECWNSGVPSGSTGSIEFDLSGILIEKKNHITQYVDGTRSTGIAYDSSGYCYNATINGAISPSTDTVRYKNSILFGNGSNLYPGMFPSFLTNLATVSMWVKLDLLPPSNPGRTMLYTAWYGFSCEITSSGSTYFRTYLNNNTVDSPSGTISAGNWVHWVGVKSPTGVSLYLNGTLIGTTSSNNNFTLSNINNTIACYGGSYYLYGKLSDVRLYATALSADDISDLYKLGALIS